jgi:rubrerythrin
MDQAYCEALAIALDFELKGEAFYRQLIDKVSDPFAKKVLTFLADEEVEHIRKIEAFNDSLLGNGEFDFEAECSLDVPERIQKFVESRRQEAEKNVSPDSNDIDIYDVALLLEQKSYEFYEKALATTEGDEKVETFFRFLLAEEQEHYDFLAYSKRYLEDPSYYFEEYGGWIFG